jgi:hypothetical protein
LNVADTGTAAAAAGAIQTSFAVDISVVVFRAVMVVILEMKVPALFVAVSFRV